MSHEPCALTEKERMKEKKEQKERMKRKNGKPFAYMHESADVPFEPSYNPSG